MTKEELLQQASISVLNSLLETTQHSVVLSLELKDLYAHVAVLYAKSLINALDKKDYEIIDWLKKNNKSGIKL